MKDTHSSSRPQVGNDNHSLSPAPGPQKSLVRDLVMGVRFFSRLPTGAGAHETPSLERMAPALGFSSVVIGVGPALVLGAGLLLGLPPLLAACFGVGAHIVVTGAMGEDGLGDSMDGLFGGHSPQQRLDIMKDSTHGSYGVAAMVLFIATRIIILGTLAANSLAGALLLWLGAQVMARQGALWLPLRLPAARSSGAAHDSGPLAKGAFTMGAAIALLIGFVLSAGFVGVVGFVGALGAGAGVIWWWSRTCTRLIGGHSGDLIGALQVLLEISILTTFILFI